MGTLISGDRHRNSSTPFDVFDAHQRSPAARADLRVRDAMKALATCITTKEYPLDPVGASPISTLGPDLLALARWTAHHAGTVGPGTDNNQAVRLRLIRADGPHP